MYYIVFGAISLALTLYLYSYFSTLTSWDSYFVWVAAMSVTTFVIYAMDKILAKVSGSRVPEALLHLLAVLGGFPGAWMGILLFRHKRSPRRHPRIWFFLVLGTLFHAVLIYLLFFRAG